MNYSAIKTNDIANGLGVRISLFVSGCRNKCKGCFNQSTWDFSSGDLFDEDVKKYILSEIKKDYVDGLSILGGDPLEPENFEALRDFIKEVKEVTEKNIWLYTGYTLENVTRFHPDWIGFLASWVNVVVDGSFIEEKKDITLKYKGSSNQRIICMDFETEKELEHNNIPYIRVLDVV